MHVKFQNFWAILEFFLEKKVIEEYKQCCPVLLNVQSKIVIAIHKPKSAACELRPKSSHALMISVVNLIVGILIFVLIT